jgi:hypothetical protein
MCGFGGKVKHGRAKPPKILTVVRGKPLGVHRALI